MIQLKL